MAGSCCVLVAKARDENTSVFPVAPKLDCSKPLDELVKHQTEEEAEATCARIRAVLPKDCTVFTWEGDDHWRAVIAQSMVQIASHGLSVHCDKTYVVGKLPEVKGTFTQDQWFALQDLLCLGTELSRKWLGKITRANNPPAMLYKLWPEIIADFIQLTDSEDEQDENEHEDQWDYKVEELAERYHDQPEREMKKYVREYYPYLQDRVLAECRKLKNELGAEKKIEVEDPAPDYEPEHRPENNERDYERRLLAQADRHNRELVDRAERAG